MSLNRQLVDQIDVALKKVREIQSENAKQTQKAQAGYDSQVSSLQAQNFFRRNKPKVILGGAITFSVLMTAISVWGLVDTFLLPHHRSYDKTPDPYATRRNVDLIGGIIGTSAGLVSLTLNICAMVIYLRHSATFSPCCNAMPELPIPPSTVVSKNKLSDHFISEQCENIIYLCMQMMDIMDSKLDPKEKIQFNFFYPIMPKLNIDGTTQFQDPQQFRMEKIQKKLTVKNAIEIIQKFKTFIEKNTLSVNNKNLLSERLKACMPFCQPYQTHNESTPLLSLQIQ